MFDRRSGITCEECLQNCINHQDERSIWVCRTLTYDNRWQICDLYAVIGTAYPQYLIDYPGRDYFE
ncbi:unnamed protein product [Enterobius vermicularis]|uniref:Apple domain-containing protein n=1 Tax=Enterobius vermicularis TaxID=51028 RepID=A0A0N4UVC1_ENTVE|nr:unnamed protein product [Enterobius vermicularis]